MREPIDQPDLVLAKASLFGHVKNGVLQDHDILVKNGEIMGWVKT